VNSSAVRIVLRYAFGVGSDAMLAGLHKYTIRRAILAFGKGRGGTEFRDST
jgi:hypothetical protein